MRLYTYIIVIIAVTCMHDIRYANLYNLCVFLFPIAALSPLTHNCHLLVAPISRHVICIEKDKLHRAIIIFNCYAY